MCPAKRGSLETIPNRMIIKMTPRHDLQEYKGSGLDYGPLLADASAQLLYG